ncbi:MAG: response regulator transcription factor [Acidimicrobiia bacterium]|nr:response regulator transcription factor [Acidimicrobiia bacterium]
MSDFLDDDAVDEDAIRVVLCDDHALFRRGLVMVLEDEPDIEILAEAADGREAVDACIDLAPEVVLMDIRMPSFGGIEATRAIREAIPSARVLMLTVSDDEEDLFGSIRAGAAAMLLKEISIDEVAEHGAGGRAGETFMSPPMGSKLLQEFSELSRRAEAAEAAGAAAPRLTDRELQVLEKVAEGLSNRRIAEELEISENTVKNHVRNILEKLHLHSRMEAVLLRGRENILEL